MTDLPVLIDVVRSGFVEGHHRGSVVAVDPAGEVVWGMGDVESPVFPRSCNKPIQAAAMVRNGLVLRGPLLALASASHSGEPMHVEGVREILAGAGLDEAALQTPLDYPIDEEAREDFIRAGGHQSAIAMNCSGKHAAMLATCVANGWDVGTYTATTHPLQGSIMEVFAELTVEPVNAVGVDGCGAPLLATSLTGLARAFSSIVQAPAESAEGQVADAIVGSPEMASGTRRDEARLLRAYPGAIGKAGAESCYAVAMPDGTAVALKIDDGHPRGRPVVMAAALRRLGYTGDELDAIGHVALLGAGRPVGELRSTF